MRLRRVIWRVLAVAFGLAMAIIIVEAGIRLAYHSLPMGLQIALRDVYETPFSDQQLAPPPLWQTDKDYLTIVRPGAVDSLQAGSPDVTFHVSSYSWWGGRVGFRSTQPEDGRVDAAALGDSFTFCFTELPDCWVTQLAAQTGLNIANLGQPVTGSVSHARIFNDFVAKPELGIGQPRLVIWQFYGNDYNDDYGLALLDGTAKTPAAAESIVPPLPTSPLAVWLRQHSAIYALTSTLLRGKNPGIEKFVDPHRANAGNVTITFGQSYIREAFDVAEARNQEGERLSREAILRTRDTVQKNGGTFVIILIPTKEEVYRTLTEPEMGKVAIDAIAAPRLRLLDFCAAERLTCFDLLPGLQAKQDTQLYYPTDQHLNASGNRVVASAVAEFLRGQGISQQ